MRQMGKQKLTIGVLLRLVRALFIAVFLSVCASIPPVAAQSTTTGIVTDPLTGIALFGYDAISYFTEDAPLVGQPEYEAQWGGVSWLFANAANRDAFLHAPEVYAPQFGGYGLMALSRGYLSEGNPNIYAILGGRLFLFYSTSNRDAFMASQRSAYLEAVINWKRLSQDLIKS